ncbi:cyclin-J18 isoform X2 [Amborella trichopoda]|uniref:cyclin-J18 isoform X2 n=1 Tax=Amborella trichopoda TaxID=13333 RepID=UPI0009C0EF71|nr:cyclin-J18 isoform X2 [Amborella trichopoda]|eukprot:XP_020525990.1 cyclin-J18 isoform X2 [Amborella trichopoda]
MKLKIRAFKMGESLSVCPIGFISSQLRNQTVEFLLHSAMQLKRCPLVKYTALSFLVDRFLLSFQLGKIRFPCETTVGHWLLRPLNESNLQLFALISLWISSKMHDICSLSVKSLKSLADEIIKDQHYTELVFLKVLRFEIGAMNVTSVYMEEFLNEFREVAKKGEAVKFDVCMDILDLLYETADTSVLYHSPCFLAAATLVVAYVLSVPNQKSEFPMLSWVRSLTGCKEEDLGILVKDILQHIFKPKP